MRKWIEGRWGTEAEINIALQTADGSFFIDPKARPDLINIINS